ncbi:2,5-didehydrogluconate reductase [Modestobacter italicus]|uniref:2,5-didehydrogluconate reductase n=1 Tax=Modestobacter italicus (strain DSM 44449 / CECT 9708 / BC 501) TaxID=2732864 RepID=I4EYS4_MODI5|nr:aldo/keto reductase [Modestobacter marinus]CCH88537.1 2,5-didehydrogluconate reductase [Modestobacter marinus]
MDHTFTLNNGVQLPAVGIGTGQSSPEDTAAAIEAALATGYRYIDTAAAYGNERQVGEGIARSAVDRSEVFIQTKVWLTDHGYDQTLHAFDKSARKLGVEQIDLLMLHQPVPERFDTTVDAYRALETMLADGRVRAIGVCSFMPHRMVDLLARTEVVPAVNQVELHPYFTQPDVQRADSEHGVHTQAWSPIGGVTFYSGFGERPGRVSTLADGTIAAIAETHGKSPAQVMLRWHLQAGRSVVPKSVTPARIAENVDVFDFELTAGEVGRLDGLDRGVRGGPDPDVTNPARFEMAIPED